MALEIKLVGFYKHTNDKEEIKPNSEQAKEILFQEGSFRKMRSFNSTFGGFTDWFNVDRQQLESVLNFHQADLLGAANIYLNYFPFNNNSNAIYTSTTRALSPTTAYIIVAGEMIDTSKLSPTQGLFWRKHF